MALRVIEVRGNGNDSLRDLLAQIGFGGLLHLAEDERTDLTRRIFFATGLNPSIAVVAADDLVGHHPFVFRHQRIIEPAADQTLDGVKRVARVGNRLALCALADKPLAAVAKRDHARCRARALSVFNDANIAGGAAFHDRDARVGSAQVDADDLAHKFLLVSGNTQPEAPPVALW